MAGTKHSAEAMGFVIFFFTAPQSGADYFFFAKKKWQ